MARELMILWAGRRRRDSWDRMREKLYELQIRESELKSKFFAAHPAVIAIEEQRQAVESVLEKQGDRPLPGHQFDRIDHLAQHLVLGELDRARIGRRR